MTFPCPGAFAPPFTSPLPMAKLTRHRFPGRPSHPSSFWRSNASLLRSAFHGFLCIAALILGFRLSGDAVFFLHLSSKGALFFRKSSSRLIEGLDVALKFPYIPDALQGSSSAHPMTGSKDRVPVRSHESGGVMILGSGREDAGGAAGEGKERQKTMPRDSPRHRGKRSARVHVGRHEILIRPQPHPDPAQILRAHQLLGLVQHQQLLLHGSHLSEKRLLAITPTLSRTFQALHMVSLIHSFRAARALLTWIVVEAGGISNETAFLLSTSGLPYHHLGVPISTEAFWRDRVQLEAHLRAEGMRFVIQHRLEGIVVFMDDSNTHTLEFFLEAQKTEWLGTFSVGLLSNSVSGNLNKELSHQMLPVQGPRCGPNGHVIGWYTPRETQMTSGAMPRRILEWAGFSLNARLLWQDRAIPAGFRSGHEIFGENQSSVQSPLDFVANVSVVEPLGNCGRDVLVWWQRVDARADSKFPSKWVIYPQLEVVVPSKRTPWLDPPPRNSVVPSTITTGRGQRKHKNKQSAKGKTRKGSRRDQRIKQVSDSDLEQP